jgi:hypothetical protein
MEVKKKTRKKRTIILTDENENSVVNEVNDENLKSQLPEIVHLTKKDNFEENVLNYESTFCEYKPTLEVPDAYNKEDNFISIPDNILNTSLKDFSCKKIDETEWPKKTEVYCLWCCHPFETTPIGLPLKYIKQVFYCTGNFCSFECAASHNYEVTDVNTNMWERFNLLNLLAIDNQIIWTLKCAKPKSTLKIFGGNLDIGEFRKKSKNVIYFKNKYPMIPVCEQIEELGDTFSTNNKEFFTIKKDRNKQTSIKEFY